MTDEAVEAAEGAAPGTLRLIKLLGFHCERCGGEWVPRDIEKPPRVCPKCKSPYWDRPRRTVS
jgi:predicted Zn-ribbon and HTH transcriptional regulator